MRIAVIGFIVFVGTMSLAADVGAFVARDSDGELVAEYRLTNAPGLTNACSDFAFGDKVVSAYRVLVSEAEYAAGWAALAQAKKDAAKAAAASERADMDAKMDRLLKAFALVTLDEVNNCREWVAAFKAATAAATSLADLKTRVASLPDMPDRTAAQLKAAVSAKYQTLP